MITSLMLKNNSAYATVCENFTKTDLLNNYNNNFKNNIFLEAVDVE